MISINRSTASTSRNNLLFVSGQGMTAIQLVPNVQCSQGHKFIFTGSGEVHVSVDY